MPMERRKNLSRPARPGVRRARTALLIARTRKPSDSALAVGPDRVDQTVNSRTGMFSLRLLAAITLLATAGGATAFKSAAPGPSQHKIAPVGLFIASIEEGARIFTPVRLLPFDHPDAEGHEFPNALQLHRSEYDALVWLGGQVGLRLSATLQRYPKAPAEEWWLEGFDEIPVGEIRAAPVERLPRSEAPIPGLRAVAIHEGRAICFIVDTRGLSLEERGMERPATMGLDMTRAEFLAGLDQVARAHAADDIRIVVTYLGDSPGRQ